MRSGFTLLELLVVIGIVTIVSAVIVLALNPAELLRQARDSNRLSDYDTLNRAFNLLNLDTAQVFGSASTVYISIPDPAATSIQGTDCSGVAGLPPLPPSWSYHCAASSTFRSVNGAGWIPVDFGLVSSGAPFGALPVDPINTVESGFFYAYVAGGNRYVFTLPLESEKYLSSGRLTFRDQGTDPTRLESGTNLLLWARATGLNAYWRFDESGGTTASDVSGNSNTGTLVGSTSWTAGKIGSAIKFNGLKGNYVSVSHSTSLDLTGDLSLVAWVKLDSAPPASGASAQPRVFQKGTDAPDNVAYVLGINSNAGSKPNITVRIGATFYNATSPTDITVGQWSHLAGVRQGTSLKIYVDGAEKTDATIPSTNLNSIAQELLMSESLGNTDGVLDGAVDDGRVYNRAISAAEIRALYKATK